MHFVLVHLATSWQKYRKHHLSSPGYLNQQHLGTLLLYKRRLVVPGLRILICSRTSVAVDYSFLSSHESHFVVCCHHTHSTCVFQSRTEMQMQVFLCTAYSLVSVATVQIPSHYLIMPSVQSPCTLNEEQMVAYTVVTHIPPAFFVYLL